MKTKVKLTSLLLAATVFLLSLLGLGGTILAHAEGADAGNPEGMRTSLYYFSDYYKSEELYESGYIRSYIDQNPNITYSELHYADEIDFWAMIIDFYNNGNVDISDAFVIFELRKGFNREIISPFDEEEGQADAIYDLLYELFYSLHEERNCKIMFICGTDEARFDSYSEYLGRNRNAFLEFADIHINTDLRTLYYYTAIKRMEEANEGEWENTTVVLDNSIGDSWEFFKTLILYFITTYPEKDYHPFSPERVLEEMGVTVFFYKQYGVYVDPYMPSYEEENGYFMKKWEDAQLGYIIGGPKAEDNLELWDLHDYRYNETYLFPFNYDWDRIDNYLPDIMYVFIFGELIDLQFYDNWEGLCEVIFKPIDFSPDGWLLVPAYMLWLGMITDLTDSEIFHLNDEEMIALEQFLKSSTPEFAQWT